MLDPTINCKLFLHFRLIANYLAIDPPPMAPEPADRHFDLVVENCRYSVKIKGQSSEAISNSAAAAIEILRAVPPINTPAERIAKTMILGGVLSITSLAI